MTAKLLRRRAALVVTSLWLAGCATRQDLAQYTGQGPVSLSAQSQTAWQYRYLEQGTPLAFALSADGKMAAWNGCAAKEGIRGNVNYVCQNRDSIPKAVAECRAKSFGEPCFLYGWMGKVVWKQ